MINVIVIVWLLMIMPFDIHGQVEDSVKGKQLSASGINSGSGIKWIEGLTWEQVKDKAKLENKYVFIDAFATWCKPCKEMDKNVFTNDTVIRQVNADFVAVKIQGDKTNKDAEAVRNWYSDAEKLKKQYRINSFPTYLFLNPSGELVHVAVGYKSTIDFVIELKEATKPGKKYVNPYEEYDQFVKRYEQGIKNYSEMPEMIRTARGLAEIEVAKKMAKDYTDRLFNLGEDSLYKKESIEGFISIYDIISGKSRIFGLFFPDGVKADLAMGITGFSQKVVDNTIQHEIARPYMGNFVGNVLAFTTPKNLKIPAWKKLYKEIRKRYGSEYAKRNVLTAKVKFYHKTAIYEDWAKVFHKSIDKYGIDTLVQDWTSEVNMAAWTIFQTQDNKKYLNLGIKLMKTVLERYPDATSYIDTYANLLYKAGKVEEAISWETKAIEQLSDKMPNRRKQFAAILEKMKRGEPTWTGKIF